MDGRRGAGGELFGSGIESLQQLLIAACTCGCVAGSVSCLLEQTHR